MSPTTTRFVRLSGLRHRLSIWPGVGRPWLMLHGWLDQGDSFSAIASRLRAPVIALDFRGHGHSEWIGRGGYYHFIDYVRDVAELLEDASELRGSVDLVGHSMGGTVATYVAGTLGERIRSLALLDGTGPPGMQPEDAPARTRRWLRQLLATRTRVAPGPANDLIARMAVAHPELTPAIAREHALRCSLPEGNVRRWRYDPLHRTTSPTPFLQATYLAFARAYAGPVLALHGGASWMRSELMRGLREAAFSGPVSREVVAGAGHMLHLTHAAEVAAHLEGFRRHVDRDPSGTLPPGADSPGS